MCIVLLPAAPCPLGLASQHFPTANEMVAAAINLIKLNLILPAAVLNQRTAVLKLAARGRIERARHIASQRCPRTLGRGLGHRRGIQQGRGVGMEMLAVYHL